MSKFYFCNTIGDGSEDTPFSPAISKYSDDWRAVDARVDATKPGVLMVECTITNDKHNLALLDSDVTYFDIKGIGLDDAVENIVDRKELKDNLAAQGISIIGLSSKSTLREVLSKTVNQLLKRQNPSHTIKKNHYDN